MAKPNFLIIGAEKSGTTWLYDRLRRHPDVFMPSVKELHFFNSRNSNLEPADTYASKGLEWYEYHFRNVDGEAAVGEATPMYLCDSLAPARIREVLPDAQLIACLRYPTDRAYSHYWMAHGKDHVRKDFKELVRERDPRFVERGSYGEQLNQYLSHFDRDQILILIHEEIFEEPSRTLNRVCSFLDVSDTFFQNEHWITEKVHPSSTERSIVLHRAIGAIAKWMRCHKGTRRLLDWIKSMGMASWLKKANKKPRQYPEMPSGVRKELDVYYTPTVRRVENLLGRRIESWREQSTTEI
ncbi:sulfotransferase domain-containing protein [Salinibacter ruber]|uniref:sulfotransferase domain-containing protein n=1 Tax=Salinibacter ruber TaxID=146919 RepID=UPI002166E118|nr:sulfotransferase domain-containing protein [Salinibacter ruber]MCS4150735.1 hypothetical protein [Salinibacter ruber]